jgi:ABC-type enterobactin transport system permease subunit
VVYADLGAALGALSGAALASPFLAGRRIDGKEDRLWAASTGAGLLLGATLGVLLAPSPSAAPSPLVSGLKGWSPSFGPSPFAQLHEQSTVLSLRHAL